MGSVEKLTDILTGSNWNVWATKMEDFLSSMGLWLYVTRECPIPALAEGARAAAANAARAE
jgi:hypothetical protein